MKRLPVLLSGVVLLAGGLAVAQVPAQQQQQQQPAAPAAPAAEAKPAWMEYKPSYAGEESDISNPHRTHDEITTWAQQAVVDVLSFSRDNYNDKVNGFKKYFAPQGWQLYVNYLKDSKIVDVVGQGYTIGAIVNDTPEIVNQGSSAGAYHWIMRMPVTISFYQKNEDGTPKPATSSKFFLFVDVLRVTQPGSEGGIAITNWRMMESPKN